MSKTREDLIVSYLSDRVETCREICAGNIEPSVAMFDLVKELDDDLSYYCYTEIRGSGSKIEKFGSKIFVEEPFPPKIPGLVHYRGFHKK